MSASQIKDYENQLRRAQLSSDVGALERLLDDDLVFTALDGSVVGKRDDLELHRSGRLRISKMEPGDLRVLHFGAVAVVNVQMEAEAVLDGVSSSGHLRYTRVWVQRSDGWRIVAGHISVVSIEN